VEVEPNRRTDGLTVGRALADLQVSTLAAVCGLAALAIGSVGPWATVLAVSVPGTRGDGRVTLALAVVAALLLATRRRFAATLAGLAMVVATAVAGYDALHIEHVAGQATVLGAQIASAGWGVYAAALGAVVALLALAAERARL
jgi:hypothetical protein